MGNDPSPASWLVGVASAAVSETLTALAGVLPESTTARAALGLVLLGAVAFGTYTVATSTAECSEESSRLRYMGRTPGKNSKTGREVIERMRNETPPKIMDFSGVTKFKASNGKWYPLNKGDMCHKVDCVKWWNQVGRKYRPKSTEVRAFMLDSDNYVIDHYSINRSLGAKIGAVYLPPL